MGSEKYELLKELKTFVPKFRLHGKRLTFKITNPPEGTTEFEWAEQAVIEIIEYVKKDCESSDQIGFTFSSDQFKSQGWLQFKPCSEIKAGDVWDVIFSLFQSNEEEGIRTTDTFRLHVTRVSMPVGSGRRRKNYYSTYDEDCKQRKGIVTIENNDHLCLARALVVGKAFSENDPLYKKVRQNTGKLQDERARKLMEEAGVTAENGSGIPELVKFQSVLKDFNIVVYKAGRKGREVIFEGKNPNASRKINLIFGDNHYNVITSLTSAFACSYYCENCHVPYDSKTGHRCRNDCKACGAKTACEKTLAITCGDCHRDFNGEKCYENHKTNKMCDRIKKCPECLKTMNIKKRKSKHTCGEIFCQQCGTYKSSTHRCYIKVDRKKYPEDKFLFLFFDLETMQEKSHPENEETKIHEVNLCVLQKCCKNCINDDDLVDCSNCGKRQVVYYKKEVISRFMTDLMEIKKKFKTVCCISHNGQAFDMQFILKHILEKTKYTPKIIMKGTKIILLEMDNVRFIDSFNYLPMGLAKLPKAFDLPPSIKKGYFPYYFNTEENQSYNGAMPDKKYYGPDDMFEEERKKFLIWYDEQVEIGYVFNMYKELQEYCISDVDILRRACLRFREYFLKECNVDPFLESITIASACNLLFRRNFLQPDTIGLVPPRGYRNVDRQSRLALKWIISEETERNIKIDHAGRGKEKEIEKMKVDGYCSETNQVFEFQGCYYHGCPRCFPCSRENPLHNDPQDTMELRYERTGEKIRKLRELGYEVIEKWECQFREEKIRRNPNYLENHPMLAHEQLNPRDSFYGGRSGCSKLYHKVEEGEEIRYVDVCSLYPYVCKYGKFPVGHPTVYVGEECKQLCGEDFDLSKVEGLIKCAVIPPTDLYHPVLPMKQNDKLMFVLCKTCGEIQNPEECTHTDEERMLVGTWVVDEVRKAVSKGYQIHDIFEIWHYNTVQYDLGNKTAGLFTEFIDKFLKIKQEASGFPSNRTSREDREKYIEEYMETEGIQLEFDAIVSNPGLRSLAKLILNSFWGRFGMRENMPQTSIIREPKELFALLANPAIAVNTIQEINEETVLVNWEYLEEVEIQSNTVNVVIAAYTTAQARLKLYDYLETLGEQVLYYDTDSVIYKYKKGQNEVKTGCFLGEMTDELETYGPGSYIIEFVSGGPKTYAYKVFTPSTNKVSYLCKVKGLTLNFSASQIVNFDQLKKMVLSQETESVIIKSKSILRTTERDVVTAPTTKTLQVNIAKRRRVEDFDTVPYGFKRTRTNEEN